MYTLMCFPLIETPVSEAVYVLLSQGDGRVGSVTFVPKAIIEGSAAMSPIFNVFPIELSGCEAM